MSDSVSGGIQDSISGAAQRVAGCGVVAIEPVKDEQFVGSAVEPPSPQFLLLFG